MHESLVTGILQLVWWVYFSENYIYFDRVTDTKFIQAMNMTACSMNLNWGDEIRRVSVSNQVAVKIESQRIKGSIGIGEEEEEEEKEGGVQSFSQNRGKFPLEEGEVQDRS